MLWPSCASRTFCGHHRVELASMDFFVSCLMQWWTYKLVCIILICIICCPIFASQVKILSNAIYHLLKCRVETKINKKLRKLDLCCVYAHGKEAKWFSPSVYTRQRRHMAVACAIWMCPVDPVDLGTFAACRSSRHTAKPQPFAVCRLSWHTIKKGHTWHCAAVRDAGNTAQFESFSCVFLDTWLTVERLVPNRQVQLSVPCRRKYTCQRLLLCTRQKFFAVPI
jgi:hypothetical protein